MIDACSPRTRTTEFQALPYLIKDSTIQDYFKVDNNCIAFFASPEDKRNDKPECKIYADEFEYMRRLIINADPDTILRIYQTKGSERFSESMLQNLPQIDPPFSPQIDSPQPLKGLRIALDPGHIAADSTNAELEGKYIKMRPSPQTHDQTISFNEANLTLTTAFLLREMLEAKGATVFQTREEAGISVRGFTFEEWLEKQFEQDLADELEKGNLSEMQVEWFKNEATLAEKYQKLFVKLDLRQRAKMINEFKPHITIMIHYNVHLGNWQVRDSEGFFKPGRANYNMVFVPGSFMAGELNKVEQRIAFLRLLLTKDLQKSIHFSEYVIRQFTEKLDVKPVPNNPNITYLHRSCIGAEEKGVFARNLYLTQHIKGTICFGESLCQDFTEEALRLNKRDIEVHNIPTSSRVKDVAEAYYNAILAFYGIHTIE